MYYFAVTQQTTKAKFSAFFQRFQTKQHVLRINPIVTELFIRGRKLNISLVFITQFYFAVPKNIRLNSTHYFIMKIPNKQELQQIKFIHSSDIGIRDFMYLYKKMYCKTIFFFSY